VLERYGRNGGRVHREGCGVPQIGTPRDIVHLHHRPPLASTGYCSSTVDLLHPPPVTVHPWAPVHPASTARSSTGYCSTSPLHGVLFNHPSTSYCLSSPPPATVQPALHRILFNLPSTGSCSSSPRVLFIQTPTGSVRVQCLAPTRAYMYERNVQTSVHRSPSTIHRNRELLDIFLALASTMVFSIMDGPKNVMQLRLRPAQDEKPILCHDFLS